MKKHYETLGVKENATPDEIKRAYRAKAKATHPDAGGAQADFEPVVKAYETLSDPERRMLYDTTGQDKRPPIEIEVQNILMEGFGRALAAEEDVEIIAFVRNGITTMLDALPVEQKNLEARKKKLTAKRKKIKSKGVNLVHMLIDGELKNIEAHLTVLKHRKEVGKACLKTLKSYSEEFEAPALTMADFIAHRSIARDPFGFRMK